MRLYLASKSPRRQELLSLLDIPFTVLDSHLDEEAFASMRKEHFPNESTLNFSQALSEAKAQAARDVLGTDEKPYLILAADTLVLLDGQVFGKGENRHKSKTMLEALSGQAHQVITSLCLMNAQGILQSSSEVTEVCFAELTDAEIERYLDSGESFDKAGAYAAQGKAAAFITKITGDFFNVVGLPLHRCYRWLEPYRALLD